ncbi:MAG: hypothetical protein HWD85_12595 [Flavobacteriaceae bacterium]|nr:hypothetical protein [Flavobacteriaceae bacterium]
MKAITHFNKSILATVFAFAFLLSVTPAIGQTSITTSKGKTYHISSTSKNGVRTYHIKDGQKDFRIEYEGDITLSDDDKDIVAISRGGFIEIKKSSFGTKRRILIHNENGTLVKKYFVGWSEKPYSPDGKKWLSEILPEILRTSTIAANTRVNRFYNKGGAKAVLKEVSSMNKDYVKSAYIKLLLEKNLNTSDLVKTIEFTGEYIKSDHYVSQILKSNQKAFLKSERTTTAYINATKNIGSDHYATSVLKKVIEDKEITDSQLATLLEITKGIKSDHYISQLLKNIIDSRKLNARNMSKALDLIKRMKSDHYKVSILKKAMNTKGLSKNNYNQFLNIVHDLKSDHYKATVVKVLLENKSANSLNTALSIINNNIRSSHYMASMYKKMVETYNLSESQLIDVINSAEKNIRSSHNLSSVLVALSKQVNRSSEKVKDAYKKAAKTIKSDTYYGRAMKAIN